MSIGIGIDGKSGFGTSLIYLYYSKLIDFCILRLMIETHFIVAVIKRKRPQ